MEELYMKKFIIFSVIGTAVTFVATMLWQRMLRKHYIDNFNIIDDDYFNEIDEENMSSNYA